MKGENGRKSDPAASLIQYGGLSLISSPHLSKQAGSNQAGCRFDLARCSPMRPPSSPPRLPRSQVSPAGATFGVWQGTLPSLFLAYSLLDVLAGKTLICHLFRNAW